MLYIFCWPDATPFWWDVSAPTNIGELLDDRVHLVITDIEVGQNQHPVIDNLGPATTEDMPIIIDDETMDDESNGAKVIKMKNVKSKGKFRRHVKVPIVSPNGMAMTKVVENDLFSAIVPVTNVHRSATVRAE